MENVGLHLVAKDINKKIILLGCLGWTEEFIRPHFHPQLIGPQVSCGLKLFKLLDPFSSPKIQSPVRITQYSYLLVNSSFYFYTAWQNEEIADKWWACTMEKPPWSSASQVGKCSFKVILSKSYDNGFHGGGEERQETNIHNYLKWLKR